MRRRTKSEQEPVRTTSDAAWKGDVSLGAGDKKAFAQKWSNEAADACAEAAGP